MPQYFWQSAEWPHFRWDSAQLLVPLARARKKQGSFLEAMSRLGFKDSLEAWSKVMEEDAIHTAAIEGEKLDREGVRSSIAEHLGLPYAGLRGADRKIDGLVQVLCDSTHNCDKAFDAGRLKAWHASLFPTGYSDFYAVRAGAWRETAMQVVSGPIGRQKVHYEAPAPKQLEAEMARFFQWWEVSRAELDGVLRSALAHLYFVTVHPFEDGNGRLARALSDMALAQDEAAGRRFYSMSAQIMKERAAYYDVLERTQKGDGDCTEWLLWFIGCFERSLDAAGGIVRAVTFKGQFWEHYKDVPLSDRQRKVLNRLLDAGRDGFEGGLSTRKYMGITKTSRATAWRELDDLLQKGMLRPLEKGGRSTAYEIDWSLGGQSEVAAIHEALHSADAGDFAMENELAELTKRWTVTGLEPKE